MLHQIFRSQKLLIVLLSIVLLTEFVSARTTSNISQSVAPNTEVIEKDNVPVSDYQPKSLNEGASEIVEKILNVPVTLNFDEEPVTKPGRGFYGGHRRNFDLNPEEEKIDDGQFGSRIILGIVENVPETTTPSPTTDQRKSQTIVKFFNKEDYNGIKTSPIVVEDPYENYDNNQEEKVRSRKEILHLKQEESPIVPDDQLKQKNDNQEEYTDENEEIENAKSEDEIHEELEQNHNTKEDDEPSKIEEEEIEPEYEIKELPQKQQYIEESPPRHIHEDTDSEKLRYEQYEIPHNHKEIYAEIKDPDTNPKFHDGQEEDTKPNLDKSEETPVKYRTHENHQIEKPSDHENHPRESARASEFKEDITQSDQKGSADQTHEDVKKKKKAEKHSAGKGEEHHSEKHGHKGEKGVKAYKGFHEETKSKKGHHDKEGIGNKYSDKGGSEKKHHEEQAHHGEHHKGEKGEKSSDFTEEGKHSKGHSTKGEHNIHKKDEYEKKQEFYDEHHEGGEHEKHGGFHFDDHFEKGGHEKGGHHKKGDHKDHYGKDSHHEKGHHYDEKKGHKKSGGHDEHHSDHSKHGKKKANSGKKHWAYKKGTGGGGGKKHYKTGPQVAHSSPQLIKRVPPSTKSIYKEEDPRYPHYISRIYVRNDNRRNDEGSDNENSDKKNAEIDHKKEEIKNESIDELKPNEGVVEQSSSGEFPLFQESDSEETKVVNKSIKDSDDLYELPENEKEVQDSQRNEEYKRPDSSDSREESSISNNSSNSLPKIYVIVPKSFEEQLRSNEDNSDKRSSAESEGDENSSYYDSDENYTEETPRRNKITHIRRKSTKIVEPLFAETFPEEHKRRLSEIEYVIHRIGIGAKKNEVEAKNKPRKFSISNSSEEA